MKKFDPSNAGAIYTRSFSQFVAEQETLARLWSGIDTIPFLQHACAVGEHEACVTLLNHYDDLVKCKAGDDAGCEKANLPGIQGTYIAHLAAKPAWVPPPVTGPVTVAVVPPPPPACSAHISGATFAGDLAIASSWNIDETYLTYFDVTDPVHPCVVGGKLLTANPERPNTFTGPGTAHIAGSARGVATIHHLDGFANGTAERDGLLFHAHLAAENRRHVQQVVDQPFQ